MSERRRHRFRQQVPQTSSSPPSPSGSVSYRVLIAVGIGAVVCLLFSDSLGVRNFVMGFKAWKRVELDPAPIIVKEYTHDTKAFLQGLEFDNTIDEPRILYESTGLYGQSVVRKYDLQSGKILAETRLDKKYFGEGLTIAGDEVYQLTWLEHTVFVYNSSDLSLRRVLSLPTEGWGICFDLERRRFIVSDGSDFLFFYSQDDFTPQGKIQVKEPFRKDRFRAVSRINELELVDGKVWANVWMQNRIIVINPETGIVENQLNFEHVVDRIRRQGFQTQNEAVLNGIAFHRKTRTLIVSGKLWPTLYHVKTLLT